MSEERKHNFVISNYENFLRKKNNREWSRNFAPIAQWFMDISHLWTVNASFSSDISSKWKWTTSRVWSIRWVSISQCHWCMPWPNGWLVVFYEGLCKSNLRFKDLPLIGTTALCPFEGASSFILSVWLDHRWHNSRQYEEWTQPEVRGCENAPQLSFPVASNVSVLKDLWKSEDNRLSSASWA